jgi:hypothetical protein
VTVAVPPLLQPAPLLKATVARVTQLKLRPATFRVRRARDAGTDVRYSLSAASKVAVEVERRTGRHYVRLKGPTTLNGAAGANSFHFSGRRLKAGRYRLLLTPVAADGFRGASKSARFRVTD